MNLELVIDDRVLGRLAGHAAAHVPGVARLQPTTARRVARGAVELARRGLTRGEGDDSPDSAVDAVEIEASGGETSLTVRIVATGVPAVIDTVAAVQQAVAESVRLHLDLEVDVCVVIVDVDCEPADTISL